MIRTSPDDTIAAISTPPGQGGIGIVRVSGPEAVAIVARLFESTTGRDIQTDSHRIHHGAIRDDAAKLDEVLVHVMRAPHSYTREDVVEINGHGGSATMNAVLELVLREGARLADPGEFTLRAFLSGRIDLTQAESVVDRIQAQTRAGLLAASAAAAGGLRKAVEEMNAALRSIKAQIEAAVDFVEQELPESITPQLRADIIGLRDKMSALFETADVGRLIREGASVTIAGRPNVGKSSLFNALLRDARAIVTEHAGTTRDTLQEVINIGGIPVRLSDTAGLRQTEDAVEQIGVSVARQALQDSAAIILVLDGSMRLNVEDEELLRELADSTAPILAVWNKSDAGNDGVIDLEHPGIVEQLSVSALTGEGLPEFEQSLGNLLTHGHDIAPDQALITRLHQKDSLRRALDAVTRLIDVLDDSPEFMSMEVDDALHALGEITGETTPDDILEEVFARFCIGK